MKVTNDAHEPLIQTIFVKAEMEVEEELTIKAGEMTHENRNLRRHEVIQKI